MKLRLSKELSFISKRLKALQIKYEFRHGIIHLSPFIYSFYPQTSVIEAEGAGSVRTLTALFNALADVAGINVIISPALD